MLGAGLLQTRKRPAGILIMATGSALAGAGLIFGRLAYLGGTNTVTLLLFRFALVVGVLWVYFSRNSQRWRLTGSTLWMTVGLGIVHGFSSFTYIGALRYIPTSLTVLIVYTYPPMVSLLAHVAGDEALTWRRAAALLLSFAGLAIALELSFKGLSAIGVGMAAAAAVSFAFALMLSSRLMRRVSPIVVQFHIAIVNVLLLTLIGVIGRSLILPGLPVGWLGMIGLGSAFLIAFLAFGAGIYLLGPSLTAIVNNLEPTVAVILSILVLRESFGPWQAIGGGLVLAGVVLAR